MGTDSKHVFLNSMGSSTNPAHLLHTHEENKQTQWVISSQMTRPRVGRGASTESFGNTAPHWEGRIYPHMALNVHENKEETREGKWGSSLKPFNHDGKKSN